MKLHRTALILLLSAVASLSMAQEAVIRKNLPARLPNLPKIDEVRETPMKGLYEVRINDDQIFYTDSNGDFVIQGALIDAKTRTDLTEARLDKLTAIKFEDLPIKDSFVLVKGDGKRKLAVFEDPNCGFCKRLERELASIDNVTIHVFLYPVLGPDSVRKSQDIWCAKDKGKVYLDWMLDQKKPPTAECEAGALKRNLALGQKLRVNGTPALFFADGSRVPGFTSADKIEQMLTKAQP